MKGKPMSKHHKSNLGRFGDQLETDLQGYTYTTVSEWLTVADLDYQTARDMNEDPEWAADWAAEQAAAACAALDAANAAAEAWQHGACSDADLLAASQGNSSNCVLTIDDECTIYANGVPVEFVEWAGPRTSGAEDDAYHVAGYFDDDGKYRGPDQHGTYPVFAIA